MNQLPRKSRPGPRSALACVVVLALGGSVARAQTAEEVAAANNPLARVNAINLHNFYAPSIYGAPNATVNDFLIQPVFARPRMVFHVTLPLATVSGGSVNQSGLGDLNIFGAYLLPPKGRTEFGVGPVIVFPTATGEALGAGKWQAGVTVVVVAQPEPTFLVGGFLSYAHSFANGDSVQRTGVNALIFKPILVAQVGGGWYLRSTGIWSFDLEQGGWSVPFGIGAGKVVRTPHAVLNFFLEPQFTVIHDGADQPALQVLAGLNMQFPKALR